ncbi:MAG TPA: 50S ribosomal protein L10 [Acidimicrobiales bacterium]|nr:50S ribosomal protein L10 [Acidimicrobiales bacterium]
MDNPRPEKVAVVDEVRGRLAGAEATILTEYRGLTVAELAQLRQALAAVGGDYKVYKNTLVKLAVADSPHEPLSALLQGPTAIAFVSGEISAVAKALRDYARANPNLVVKGGLHGDGVLSAADLGALADLPSRDVLLARLAGAIAAPLQQFAGLLQALPRNLAYGLSALIDQQGGAPADAAPAADEATADAAPATDEATADGAPAPAEATEPAPEAAEPAAAEATEAGAEEATEAGAEEASEAAAVVEAGADEAGSDEPS